MSEPTILEAVQQRMQQVGGTCWIDELLIRGSADGINGAHIVVGWKAPGVMGAEQTGVTNAAPVTMETGNPLWEQIKAEINAAAVQQVVDLQAQVEQLTSERDAAIAALNNQSEQGDD